MDDRRAHFLTMLGDTCSAAGVARIRVELVMVDGVRVSGTPLPLPSRGDQGEIDETGYRSSMMVDGCPVNLEEVVGFAIVSP